MAIVNHSTINDPHITDIRNAIEHRATWFQLVLDEAEKAGVDWEEVGRKAITRCGVFHGNVKFTPTSDLKQFGKEFANELVKKVFEMDVQECTCDKFVVEFHYCPLVAAWLKQTDDEEKVSKLCDIAMDGDRGIISVFPDFEFDLQSTIAAGDKVCRIVITKSEKGCQKGCQA